MFCELKEAGADYLIRLAFFTMTREMAEARPRIHRLNYSNRDEIDCVVKVEDRDIETFNRAVDCYDTYRQVLRDSRVREKVGKSVHFEIFMEDFDTPLDDLCRFG